MLTVACVLRSGGAYGPEDVRKLGQGVLRHLKQPHSFVCLSDAPLGEGLDDLRIPLKHDWPGWFSKLELFRPGLFLGPVLYFDLDTVILRDLDEVTVTGEAEVVHGLANLVMLRDRRHSHILGSGIMYWHGESTLLHALYERFALDPLYYMRKYRQMPNLGDQSFIVDTLDEGSIAAWPEGLFGCLNLDDEATCRASHAAYCNWIPKLAEMATEDSWRGEIVRGAWL